MRLRPIAINRTPGARSANSRKYGDNMITYSTQLIDFIVAVKKGADNANVDTALLAEAQGLGCVRVEDNKITLTERGLIVSKMTVHYEKEPTFTTFHYVVAAFILAVGLFSLWWLAQEKLIGFETMLLASLALTIATGIVISVQGMKFTRRRVQVIED